jgi:hypothetical protein
MYRPYRCITIRENGLITIFLESLALITIFCQDTVLITMVNWGSTAPILLRDSPGMNQ